MSFCLWITGLPGSGKSTIVRELEPLFSAAGFPWTTLGLDEIRRFLTPAAKYTDEEREIVYRSLVLMAQLLIEQSEKNVIIDATANRRVFRQMARERIPDFAEVYVKCPIEICQSRESLRDAENIQQHLYQKAKARQLTGELPGVSTPYEEPLDPEIVVPSDELTPRESAEIILDYVTWRWKTKGNL